MTGLVKDPQGQTLSNARVTEFQTDKEYTTDAEGKFVSAYGPSDTRRFFFAVHKQRKMVGVGRLSAEGRHVEINLASAKIVSGKVVGPDGKPVAGVQVAPLPMTNFHVLTNNQGEFDVGWDPDWAGRNKNLCLLARHAKLNLAALVNITPNTETVDIKLRHGLLLTGTVEDPNGGPFPGVKVSISLIKGFWRCSTPVKSVITDDKGRYEFRALPQKQKYGIGTNPEGYGSTSITTGLINIAKDVAEVEPIVPKPMNMSVSGIVIDVNGHSVEAATVTLGGKGQPHREAKTDANGRFTLNNICDGNFTLDATKTHQLTGYIPNVQAGAENVEIVVFQWPQRRITPEEPPFEPNPQADILKYRWSDRGWRLLEGKDFQRINMTTHKPNGIRLGNLKNDNVLFGQWHSPVVKGGYRWIALDHTYKYGQYDRLIMDTNGDGHLGDEIVTMAKSSSQPSTENYFISFGPVEVLMNQDNEPRICHLSLGFYYNDKELCTGTIGWYEGYVTVSGAKKRCLLVDKNSDGTFDTKSPNMSESDLIAFGEEDQRIVRTVGEYVELDGNMYCLGINRGLDSMKVSLIPAKEVLFGTIRLSKSITKFTAVGQNGLFTVHPNEGLAKLPVGTYCIDNWITEQKDEQGNKWTLKGHSFGDSGIFQVSEGRQTALSVGEPIFTSLEQANQEDDVFNFINPKLYGQLSEEINLNCNEDDLRLLLHIKSKDHSYNRTFTFEYG
ncbi:MAG: carboxypeptidase regulatory-like domain-containing protein [Planctomycetota bacterium]